MQINLEAMKKLAIMENARARKTWGYHNRASAYRNAESAENGKKGGRPRKVQPFRELTSKARVVNRMLKTGLNCIEIANILDKTPEAIRDMRVRYGLPREED